MPLPGRHGCPSTAPLTPGPPAGPQYGSKHSAANGSGTVRIFISLLWRTAEHFPDVSYLQKCATEIYQHYHHISQRGRPRNKVCEATVIQTEPGAPPSAPSTITQPCSCCCWRPAVPLTGQQKQLVGFRGTGMYAACRCQRETLAMVHRPCSTFGRSLTI